MSDWINVPSRSTAVVVLHTRFPLKRQDRQAGRQRRAEVSNHGKAVQGVAPPLPRPSSLTALRCHLLRQRAVRISNYSNVLQGTFAFDRGNSHRGQQHRSERPQRLDSGATPETLLADTVLRMPALEQGQKIDARTVRAPQGPSRASASSARRAF